MSKYSNPAYLFTRNALKRVMRNRTYTARRGILKGMQRRGGLDFIPRKNNAEEEFLLSLDIPGQTVLDVGAYEGIMTVFFASRTGPGGKVYSYEPNPASASIIQANAAINNLHNVTIRQVAVGSALGEAELMFSDLDPAQGSLQSDVQGNIRGQRRVQAIKVPIVTIDQEIETERVGTPNFVKIDTEGFEYDVLQGMTQTLRDIRPALYIENHGANWEQRLDNTERLTRVLYENNYEVYFVEQDEHMKTPERRWSFHLYCTPK